LGRIEATAVPTNPYVQLTAEFNAGKLRAIICSGQAVVLHRLAVMSKDGDWIVREDPADLAQVRAVLARHGAQYRYGAPLDVRWLAGGWSAHFEFRAQDGLRLRTDFFSRPPRIERDSLARLWEEQAKADVPFVPKRELALMKMTQREKDYPVIGELARGLESTDDALRLSRSALDLIKLAKKHPEAAAREAEFRPLLSFAIGVERNKLEEALDAERRRLMHADAQRLARFEAASAQWKFGWRSLERRLAGLPLDEAHAIVCAAGADLLPFAPPSP
jgi:hypothetical protein